MNVVRFNFSAQFERVVGARLGRRGGSRRAGFVRRPIHSTTPPGVPGADQIGDDSEIADPGTIVISKPKIETRTPSLYRVILVNDDYTPMDFVIHVLQRFFSKDTAEATRIMLEVHQLGAGTCGVYSFEIAETKVYQVNQYARQNRHPLKCAMEKV